MKPSRKSCSSPRNSYSYAQLIAREMADNAIDDYAVAKQRVSARLQLQKASIPSNSEIEAALRDYLQLFDAEGHAQRLQQLDKAASTLMQWLEEYSPYATGAVVSRVAPRGSSLTLHIYGHAVETIFAQLQQRNIPLHSSEEVITTATNQRVKVPKLQFIAGTLPCEVVVLPQNYWQQAPRCPVRGSALQRLNRSQLLQLSA